MPSGCGRANTNRLPEPGTGAITEQRTPGRVSSRSTRWVPRLGRSRISGTSWPAQTPVALMTARARIVRVSPVRASVRTAPVAGRLADPHAGVHAGTLGRGGAGHGEDQAYVVLELAVPGEQRPAQPLPAYDGGERRASRWR